MKYNSLLDFEGESLKLSVRIGNDEGFLAAPVEKVSTQVAVFHPDLSLYEGDFYDTVMLTPYELKMSGVSKRPREELEEAAALCEKDPYDPDWFWFEPDVTITFYLCDGTQFTLGSSIDKTIAAAKAGHGTGLIHDKDHNLGSGAGGDETTGEFSKSISFHGWQLDVSKVTAVEINERNGLK